jgi:hypothetical protein
MADTKCPGCIDPITKFIELNRNPTSLCEDCRRFEGLYSNETPAWNKNMYDTKSDKKPNSQIWNLTYKYAMKIARSLSTNIKNFRFGKVKGGISMWEKLKKIFGKSDKQKEIYKIFRSLHKSSLQPEEKIKYLKSKGDVYSKIGEFFEGLEIAVESCLFNERNASSSFN